MKRIAKFHKVSLEQFMEGWKDAFGEQYTEDQIKALYEEVKLPKRATAGSAGYDFYAPDDFVIEPGKTIKIPTGIRVEMEENWGFLLSMELLWMTMRQQSETGDLEVRRSRVVKKSDYCIGCVGDRDQKNSVQFHCARALR